MREKLKDWGNVILRAAILLLVLFFCCWPIRLSGDSMQPNYDDGDLVLFSRLSGKILGYDVGDVVLFYDEAAGTDTTIIKRIVATEGDHVQILPEGLFINGERLKEPYITENTTGIVDLIIPPDSVFVLGDHRSHSFDSRNMGAIPLEHIEGKVLLRLFPW